MVYRTGWVAVANASGAGHFGPNPATNPNVIRQPVNVFMNIPVGSEGELS